MRPGLLALVLLGCRDGATDPKPDRRDSDSAPDPDTGPDLPVGAGSLQGRVVDAKGAPIAGASVDAAGLSATSDETGWFYLDEVPASHGLVVRAVAEGWSTGLVRVPVTDGAESYASLTLLPAQVLSWDPEDGPELSTDNGVSITFPELGLVDADGAPAPGPVQVTVTLLDVRESLAVAPGGLLASTDEGTVPLRSGGMVEVRLTDEVGAPLQLAAPAQLSFPVPDEVDPEGLTTWGLDEDLGLWTASDGGGVTDGRFETEVEHFSWWNADLPPDLQQCVVGRMLKPDGDPLQGAVINGLDDDNFISNEVRTDDDGGFQLDLTVGSTVQITLAWSEWSWEGTTATLPTTSAVDIPEDCLDLGSFTVTDNDVDDDGYLEPAIGGNDCDDTRADVHPREREIWYDGIDQDCDGNDGDQDEDGALASDYTGPYTEGFETGDCDDEDANIHPGLTETCDGVDDNCSGDEADAVDATVYYLDEDGDGYGQDEATLSACVAPEGYAAEDGDCMDSGEDAAQIHPSADVSCSGRDFNCDGIPDQSDADGDGVLGCDGDCDDGNISVYPGAEDICDELDNDCDGVTDGDSEWYHTSWPDLDGDGYGDDSAPYWGCDTPDTYVGVGGDCDDGSAARWSGADEVCDDGLVNDCDGDEATATEACDWDSDQTISSVGLAMTGDAAYDYAGTSAAAAGDVDGDGLPDLLVGTRQSDLAHSSGGVADLVLGPPSAAGLLADLAWARLAGAKSSAYAGSSVSTAGDQDGDGLDDVLVGSSNISDGGSQGGAAYVVYGLPVGEVDLDSAEAAFRGDSTLLQAGATVSGGSDLDGDGSPEVAIGGTGYPGRGYGEGAFVLLGPASGDYAPADADLSLSDSSDGVVVGGRVLLPGDTDGDGLGDLLDGSTSATVSGVKCGAAFLFVNPGTGTLSVGDADARITSGSADGVGYLFNVGDLDGDGLADLGIGARSWSSGAGMAEVWLSPLTGSHLLGDADLSVTGDSTDALAGFSGGQDVNGDGGIDLIVGAPNDTAGGTSSGAVGLYYGPLTGAVTLDDADQRLLGGTYWGGDYVGVSAAMVGDMDGDGRSELLIGATGYDSPSVDEGAAFLVHVAGY